MLRWTIRILLVFVVLIAAAAVVVHLILESDWLGDMILARVSQTVGMDVAAESLSVGWGGGTTVQKATVTMPLTGEVVLTADRIRLKHEMIPLLILGRPANVRSVQVDNPEMHLRRYENGRWNLQDVWTRLRARLDSSSDKEKKRTSLPEVIVQHAMVQVVEPNGVPQAVGPLDFRARPQGLVWQFDLEAPQVAGLKGQLLPGGDWAHDVGFAVTEIEPLIHRVLGSDLSPIQVAGRWEGRVLQGTVDGEIRLERLAIGPVAAYGNALVQAGSGRIVLRPQDLVFRDPNLAGQEIRLTDGSVEVAGSQIQVRQVAVTSRSLAARIDGRWDLDAQGGEFAGSWIAASEDPNSRYDGTYEVFVKSPPTGRKVARVNLTAGMEASFGELTVVVGVDGAGADWRQSQWLVSVPRLVWSRDGKPMDLSGATAEIRLAWPEVRLASLSMPGANTKFAEARFDASTRRWSAGLVVEDFRHLGPWGMESLNLLVNAEGDDRKAHVSQLRLAQGDRIVTAKGDLSFHERGFQDVRLTADWPAVSGRPEQPQVVQPAGGWHLEGDVFGRIQPLSVEIAGQLTGLEIPVGKGQLSRVEIPVRADANSHQVRMTTDPFDLLGGRWQLKGRHDLVTEQTHINVVADGLSLEAAAGIAGLSPTSRGRAHAQVDVAVSGFNARTAVVMGDWRAEDINIPPLHAQRARGKLRIANGLARFDTIVLEQEGGRAQANVEFRLGEPHIVSVEAKAEGWPLRFEDHPVSIWTDGQAKLLLNVVTRTAAGEATLSGKVLWQEQDFARIRISSLVQEQNLDIRELYAETLGGSIEGQAMIPLNRWMESRAKLAWKGIQPRLLQPWAPQFERFEGVVSGTLEIEQMGPSARPPEPMRFVLDADVENGRFGPAPVDSCRIVGFLGDARLLIDEARLDALEGRTTARVRVSTHGGRYYGSVAADFNNLNLDQIVHVIEPNAAPHVGYVAGTASILGSSNWDSFGGETRITLTQSDLGNSSIVAALYNTLNLHFGEQQATGTGEVTIRLEGPSVKIPSFSYFNRGIDIRGAAEIEDFNRGAESPVSGFAVGSTRVLKGIRLPGIRSLDRLLATFQTGAASVQIGGTVKTVEVNVVPLPVVLGSFRRLLWAQLHE